MDYETYKNPLTERYAGKEMSRIWSPQFKHSTWRRLWLSLASCEKKLGLEITDSQIAELAAHLDDIDFERVSEIEKSLRHDVMSHIRALAEKCPEAAPIIHLGATSCFVTDNTELIQTRESLRLIRGKLLKLIDNLAKFCDEHKAMPTLGFTHLQPAQLTTVGKRFALYLQDFLLDYRRIDREIGELPFRSVKGTTGTQASFFELFDGDHEKCRELERAVAAEFGFDHVITLSGQTYTRKIDYFVLALLSGLAQSAAKCATDIRLLAHMKEIEEPFGAKQVGSSAMAYKRNPMRCERVTSLARYVMNLPGNAAATTSTQWFERTLDDSANRRIVLPEAFLAADVILSILCDVTSGLQVWPAHRRRTALHGHRNPADGRGPQGRRPPETPRSDPHPLDGGVAPRQGGGSRQRSARPAPQCSGVCRDPRRIRFAARPRFIRRPRAASGRGFPQRRGLSAARSAPRRNGGGAVRPGQRLKQQPLLEVKKWLFSTTTI